MRAANDVRLGTTAPLPVAHELNESTSSQDRKSKRRERRKYCWQMRPHGGREGLGWKDEGLSCSCGLLFVLSCLAFTPKLLLAGSHCRIPWAGIRQDKHFVERNVFEGSPNSPRVSHVRNLSFFVVTPRGRARPLPFVFERECSACPCLSASSFIALSGDIASLPRFFLLFFSTNKASASPL